MFTISIYGRLFDVYRELYTVERQPVAEEYFIEGMTAGGVKG